MTHDILSTEMDGKASVLDLANELGGYFDADKIAVPARIETPVWGFRRKDLWPPEVWAEMERIRKGETDIPNPSEGEG